MSELGKVYIASMKMRGKWAEKPNNTIIINVTSMQSKKSQFRIDFSPMSEIEGGYKGYYCFENYWQSGKVYDNLNTEKYIEWWKDLKVGKRKYPKSKNCKVLYSNFNSIKRNYIESRKDIYIPEYYNLIKNSISIKKCKEMVQMGKNLVIYDFDGPKKLNGDNDCLLVSKELLKEKVNDGLYPFGHGYIIAGEILNIHYSNYI